MTARRLATVWSSWLYEAQSLVALLDKQSEALVRRDAEQVDAQLPEIEAKKAALETVDATARIACQEMAAELAVEPHLTAIARRLPEADAAMLSSLAKQIEVTGDRLRAAMVRNHALIENELAYFAGTLNVIGQALRDPATPYAGGAPTALTLDRTA